MLAGAVLLHRYAAFSLLTLSPALLAGLRVTALRGVSVALAFLFLGVAALAGTLATVVAVIFISCAITIMLATATVACTITAPVRLAFNHCYLKRLKTIGALRPTLGSLHRRCNDNESHH